MAKRTYLRPSVIRGNDDHSEEGLVGELRFPQNPNKYQVIVLTERSDNESTPVLLVSEKGNLVSKGNMRRLRKRSESSPDYAITLASVKTDQTKKYSVWNQGDGTYSMQEYVVKTEEKREVTVNYDF